MMKRIISLVAALLMCVLLCVPAFAVNDTYFYDCTGVSVNEQNSQIINATASDLSSKYNAEIYYVITDNLDQCATLSLYARDFYVKHADEGSEGACFVYYIRDDETYLYCTDGIGNILTEDDRNEITAVFDRAESYFKAALNYYTFFGGILESNGSLPELTASENSETEEAEEIQEIPEERQLPLVVDNAGLLSAGERNALEQKLAGYSERCQCDIAIITVPSTGNKDVELFTVDFYDYNGYGYGSGKDGLMLLLSMEERDWCVSRHGKSERIFTQNVVDDMISSVSGYLSDDDYNTAFNRFADDFVKRYESAGKISPIWIPVDLGLGFVIAYFSMKAKTSNLKSVKSKRDASDYIHHDSMHLVSDKDSFLYSNVTRTPIVREVESKGGGGGGGFIGSSGTSHSVSSGKF